MRKRILQWLFWLSISVAAVLVIYKVYLNFFENDFGAEHAIQVESIESLLRDRSQFRFAVIGNITNSVGIFERKIIPRLNAQDYDFVVSAGNAVSSGGEDKYRAVYRTLSRLQMPYLLTFGPLEESRIGGFRFYDHFGPYHYSFTAGNSRWIFLDSTGTTDFGWQMRWLDEELRNSQDQNIFVFSANPLYPVDESGLFRIGGDYLFDSSVRPGITQMLEMAQVDAVFSTILPVFDLQEHNETDYVVTGGAGGFVLNNDRSRHHYVSVRVDGNQITIQERQLDIGQHPFWRSLESLWFFIHSLFYVGYLNFILLVSLFVAAAIWLHRQIFEDRDYYPDFDIDPDVLADTPLRVSMFTNNYLPFIGGVPISIDRLHQGLQAAGHQVQIVAPRYRNSPASESGVLRLPSLLPFGHQKEFRLANIFLPRLFRQVRQFKPDVIHVHHPFWLGRAGLVIGRILGAPVVYTYHTRLEHYAHYVPLPTPLFRNLISHTLVKRFANLCDAVIVPTSSAEEYLRIIGVKSPIFVQPTGIEYQRFSEHDNSAAARLKKELNLSDEKVLISISRLSREKNIDFMLEGLAQLKSRCDQSFRLLLIGDGHDRQRLSARIESLGLKQHVTLIGSVPPDQIASYCQLGDLFVFASRSETQGMVVLEAMAAGMPVVVVRSSGIDDIVQQGVNGFKTGPSLTAWTEKVELLLGNSEQRHKMAQEAQSFAASYDTGAFSQSVSRIYRYVVVARERRHSRAGD
ncbi:MAG TPA: glycosyl transferase family 1 [Pseudohongiella sp.]|nr:glycosyl transferase family 1 [Gammaproteobacteria bacterium]HBN15049.1 glycosyl transferase family 1 [Pseudohongiella sp.]|tara:strand:- start:1023 stop:3251 length:2229 start_codon:yes stop_codon:yes gene_type:complete